MNLLVTLFSEPWLQRLGRVLIHFVWQGIGIALLLAVVLRLLTQSSSHIRYIVIGGALAICAIMPMATWIILGPQMEASVLPVIVPPITLVSKVKAPVASGLNSLSNGGMGAPVNLETRWQ